MECPDLYRKFGVNSKREAKLYLEEFTVGKRWKENARILDIGCGDGSTNKEVLQKFVPASCKQIVGCDVSEKMIEYARENYGNELVEFLVWDVSEEPAAHFRGAFDHVFSFYAMHWVKKQEAALLNIYNTLAEGGNCLLLFLGYNSMYERFRALSRTHQWAQQLKDVEILVSPYYDSKDPKGEVTARMEKVGFKEIEVKVLQKSHTYDNVDSHNNLVKSLNPITVLNDSWDEFMKDYWDVSPNALTNKYNLIVAYGSK